MSNISDLNLKKRYPVEAELYNKICDVIEEYSGRLSLMSVLGILELKQQSLCDDQND